MSFGKFRDSSKSDVSEAASYNSTGASSVVSAFLGAGTKITGNINFKGSAVIDSIVEGQIHSTELLTIGESASISGTINGSEVVIKGIVNGDIIATKKLSIKKPAKITGNITAPTVSIEEGVYFEGKCIMKREPEKISRSMPEKLEAVSQKG